MKSRHPATIAAQASGLIDPLTGGIVPPIQPATTFIRDEEYTLLNGEYSYARYHNDAGVIAETTIAQLEKADAALLFPSGMAAIASLFRTLPDGASVVVQSGIYHGTTHWIRKFCARRNVTLLELDLSDPTAMADVTQADLIWVETPSNPWLKITDIKTIAHQAQALGATLVVDSTAATPVLSQPLTLGADITMHSATKALNGHSDLLAGVLAFREKTPLFTMIESERNEAGTVIGPFEAWLLTRGIRTLPLRVERMCQTAMEVSEFLADHPGVEDVYYPGLQGFPGHHIAKAQMPGGFGYLLSVLIKGDAANALAVAGRLRLFHRATSLGGVESLVEHRHTIEPDTGIPDNLLRLSIGIEDAGDLVEDLGQALGQ